MTKLKKGNGLEKGTWKSIGTGPGSSAWMCCPSCGGRMSFTETVINKSGEIDVLQCMYEGCKFVDSITLLDWSSGQQVPTPIGTVNVLDIDKV